MTDPVTDALEGTPGAERAPASEPGAATARPEPVSATPGRRPMRAEERWRRARGAIEDEMDRVLAALDTALERGDFQPPAHGDPFTLASHVTIDAPDVPTWPYLDEDLIYARAARCTSCGAGLAYPNLPFGAGERASMWACSAVLRNEMGATEDKPTDLAAHGLGGRPKDAPEDSHDAYPFTFWKIQSESANATTRPLPSWSDEAMLRGAFLTTAKQRLVGQLGQPESTVATILERASTNGHVGMTSCEACGMRWTDFNAVPCPGRPPSPIGGS